MRKAFQITWFGFIFLALVGVYQFDCCSGVASAITVKCCKKCGRVKCCCPKPRRSCCRKCPKCQTDVCVLEAECVDEERKCFEVEQKLICIPKVSLPWRKCEKPCCGGCAANCRHQCAKTKAVKVLKTKTYECKVCQYSWKVCEPEIINEPTPSESAPSQDAPGEAPEQPQYEDSELYDPAGGDVPKAPKLNDSARALFQNLKWR